MSISVSVGIAQARCADEDRLGIWKRKDLKGRQVEAVAHLHHGQIVQPLVEATEDVPRHVDGELQVRRLHARQHELLQDRRKVGDAERRRAAERDARAAAEQVEVRDEVGLELEQPLGLLAHDAPRPGGPQDVARAIEERVAVLLFEDLDSTGHGRLGDAQHVSRPRQAPRADDFDERFQVNGLHRSLPVLSSQNVMKIMRITQFTWRSRQPTMSRLVLSAGADGISGRYADFGLVQAHTRPRRRALLF